MKKVLALFLSFCIVFTFSVFANASYYDGVAAGERYAGQEHSSAMYWAIGLPASILLSPLLGGGGTIIAAYASSPQPDSQKVSQLSQSHSSDYVNGFRAGYEDVAKSRNTRAAWGSAGIAFGINLILLESMRAGSESQEEQKNIPVPVIGFNF